MPRTLGLSLALIVTLFASPGAATPLAGEASASRALSDCWQRLPLDRAALADAPLPVGALVPCPGIRPGARVWTDNGGEVGGCTLNFVFRGTRTAPDGTSIDEGLFIGTAGHCVPGHDGEQVWAPGQGPVAMDAEDQRFGEHAYTVLIDPPDVEKNLDFSLIRVDDAREAEVKPGLCHFGGPTGMSATWGEGDVVHHFGQGMVYEDTVQGRSGVLASSDQSESSALIFAGSALFGDSGSSLIEADGDALAVVVAILPPLVFATPIAMQVERAESKLGIDLELVEAPLAA